MKLDDENKLIDKLIKWGAIPGERRCCGEKMTIVRETDRKVPRFYCQKVRVVNGEPKR
jgi:hypothetical protein